ncbi:phage-related protein [Shouchella clausii KSM-K16]|uniref:Phage-related protein n=1 Tax=Shouchella clausii (strain KSM-K16) TaxID=66692 RepID=Q5WIE1_SHOC1|nr:hypothetical protein [Shouchella clausii]BAD63864.1 phage-related protein [Shouchella clausii KSM-K16]
MNFESKYLIRWGIPGWTFITLGTIITIINFPDFVEDNFESSSQLLSITGVLLIAGVPVGYLFHQLYFFFGWVLLHKPLNRTKTMTEYLISKRLLEFIKDDYFRLEVAWHATMADMSKDKRDYVTSRYSHLLSTTHSLGVLSIVLGLILAIDVIVFYFTSKWYNLIFLLINLVMLVSSIGNFVYYSKNKNHYMSMMLSASSMNLIEEDSEENKQ